MQAQLLGFWEIDERSLFPSESVAKVASRYGWRWRRRKSMIHSHLYLPYYIECISVAYVPSVHPCTPMFENQPEIASRVRQCSQMSRNEGVAKVSDLGLWRYDREWIIPCIAADVAIVAIY